MENLKFITLSDGTALSDAQVREYLVTKFPSIVDFMSITTAPQAVDACFNALQLVFSNPDAHHLPPDDIVQITETMRIQCHMAFLFAPC